MTDINQSNWSETDSNNNSLSELPAWPEGMQPSQVDDSGRAMMGAMRRWYDHANATLTSTGSANAQTLTYSVTPEALVAGDSYLWVAGYTNTAAATLNVGVGGDVSLYMNGAALVGGEVQAGGIILTGYDGTNFQIIARSNVTVVSPFLTGEMKAWPLTTAPSGFLICNGQAVSRTTYAALFAFGGTSAPFGPGDGSTTFNVPDCRGRVLAGYDPSNATGRLTEAQTQGVSAAAIGNTGGEQGHTQTTGEMPVHSHGVSDPSHVHGLNDPGHFHEVNGSFATAYGSGGNGTDAYPSGNSNTSNSTTGIAMGYAYTGISIQNAGSGGAHNNVQPTLIVNWIIKT